MPISANKDLPFSPFVSKLVAAKRSGPVLVTRGYLGEGDKDLVRLYFDLSLETYAEIPRSAVMHAEAVTGSPHQRAELIVDARQDIRVVSVIERTLKAADIQEAMDHAKAHKTAPDPCAAPPSAPECSCGSKLPAGGAAGTMNALGRLKEQALLNEQRKRAEEEDHESGPDPLRIAGCVVAPWTCRRH
jgi:hypothetical protein